MLAMVSAVYGSTLATYIYAANAARQLFVPGIQVVVAGAVLALGVIAALRFTGSPGFSLLTIWGTFRLLNWYGWNGMEVMIIPLAGVVLYSVWKGEHGIQEPLYYKPKHCGFEFMSVLGSFSGVLLGIALFFYVPNGWLGSFTLADVVVGFVLGILSQCQLWKVPLYSVLPVINGVLAPLAALDLLSSSIRLRPCEGAELGRVEGVLLYGFMGDSVRGKEGSGKGIVGWHWVSVSDSSLISRFEEGGNVHCVVFGKSGSGKSTFVKGLLGMYRNAGYSVVIFDFHGEYVSTGWRRTRLGRGEGIDVCGLGEPEWTSLLLGDAFRSALRLGPIQYNMLVNAVREALVEGCLGNTPFISSVRKMLRRGLEEYGIGDQKSLQSLLLYLDEIEPLFSGGLNPKVEQGSVMVLDMSGLPSRRAKIVAVEILSRLFFHLASANRVGRTLLVVEEAHVLPEDTFLGKIYAEGRKFDFAAVTISQHPSSVSREIVGNSSWRFIFQLDEPGELSYASKLIAGTQEDKRRVVEETVSRLNVGETVVRGPHCGEIGVFLVKTSRTS